ncbi:MCE family protein [Nocardia asteroides NBRC 15531]|uniref:Mce family protein n=1 Tax=Nocardia asteroides NBRC 15531 TaxID=1110697 RepID=U5E5X9_NOCAS|nr:MCE family protein [Nocardia asteroides]TLF66874.1 MCE family protein [Nocardia asteroides NBRC 15531]UGT51878.1 MCE family protein [Nocardia asteroides]SFN03335.1 virulence factor Mce family protein [Nocardia asteroides]VEG35209.1 virulence factor Mce family protein [Nocardia asteroides]GAD85242.1 Mce family protein [Nocardia asteroides NBRC 15531]
MTTRHTRKLAALCATALLASGCALLPDSVTGLGERMLSEQKRISADFENVAGLYAGNEVSVLGVPVGVVDSVTPRGSYVEVVMSIDRDVRIPAEAMAALVSPQLITNRHVELAPAYSGTGPELADGAHLPLARTRTPVELDRILANFDQLGEALKGDAETGPMASRVLFPLLDGNGDRLRETLDELSAAFEVTFANKDQIANTIVKLGEITQIIAENDQTVQDFSARITELVALFGQQSPGLQAVLTQLDDFITNTSSVLGQNQDQLAGALTKFVAIAAQMRANARNLTEIVDVAPLLFQNVDNAVSREKQALRLHGLLDKIVLDSEALSLFCERVQMRLDGCRTGKIADMGPDFGLTAALLGLTK